MPTFEVVIISGLGVMIALAGGALSWWSTGSMLAMGICLIVAGCFLVLVATLMLSRRIREQRLADEELIHGGAQKEKPESELTEDKLFGVIIEMEDLCTLMDTDVIRKALEGTSVGPAFTSMVFCETGTSDFTLCPCTRSVGLTVESDFPAFEAAMLTVKGVLGVKKNKGPWNFSAEELAEREVERERIARERKRIRVENTERSEREYSAMKDFVLAKEKGNEEEFGPVAEELNRVNFDELRAYLAGITRCEAEIWIARSDILLGFVNFDHKELECESGEDALKFFEEMMSGPLTIFMPRKLDIGTIPFWADYRKKDGRKFVRLSVEGGHRWAMRGNYALFVKELAPVVATAQTTGGGE